MVYVTTELQCMYACAYFAYLCSINVRNLSQATDILNLAREVLARCPIINPARLPEVEQLLLYMQARKTTKDGETGLV